MSSKWPQVVGHEIVGKVVKVGKEVQALRIGDMVGIGAQCDSCMTCESCSESESALHRAGIHPPASLSRDPL
jgi:alcohol dehydrogenase (NADP+)